MRRHKSAKRKGCKSPTTKGIANHVCPSEVLALAFSWLNRDAASGIDEVTWKEYAENQQERLCPLGIAALEVAYLISPPPAQGVQRAVVEVLNAIYEQDFLGFSYGFRPK